MSEGKILVTNINWAWDEDDVFNEMVSMSEEDKAKFVKMARGEEIRVSCMTDEEILDDFQDGLRHNRITPEEFFNLPESVEVDADWSDEDVTNYLCDEYGFFINGYARSDD